MIATQRPPAQDDETDALVVTERVGKVAFALARGAQLTNREIQDMTGLNVSGAWLMMGRLSRVLPLTFSGYGGTWQVMADGFEGNPPMK